MPGGVYRCECEKEGRRPQHAHMPIPSIDVRTLETQSVTGTVVAQPVPPAIMESSKTPLNVWVQISMVDTLALGFGAASDSCMCV